MSELVGFLKARLDEDERFAAGAYGSSWDTDTEDDERSWVITEDMHLCEAEHASTWHIARHDPARVLHEVEAKRRILDEVIPIVSDLDEIAFGEGLAAKHPLRPGEHLSADGEPVLYLLRLLALPYASHHEYRKEWKP